MEGAERENDRAMESLADRVSALKRVTQDIQSEASLFVSPLRKQMSPPGFPLAKKWAKAPTKDTYRGLTRSPFLTHACHWQA